MDGLRIYHTWQYVFQPYVVCCYIHTLFRHEVRLAARRQERRLWDQELLHRTLGIIREGELEVTVSTYSRPTEVLSFQTAMNPFHTAHTSIRSPAFDARVRASAKKYL